LAGKYGLGRLHRQRALYGVDFLSEPIITRQNGILDDVDVVAIPYLGPVDTLPPRALHKAAGPERYFSLLAASSPYSPVLYDLPG